MASKFRSDDVWTEITKAVKKTPGRCDVAVAYFSQGAARRLPLAKGSNLVVDMSEGAVKAGQTDPREVIKLLKRGVRVHTVQDLHAKAFVIGNRAIVGSMNVSKRSAEQLFEAAIDTTEKKVVASCRLWIRRLLGEEVTPKYASKVAKLYKSPKPISRTRKRKRASVPIHPKVYVVGLPSIELDEKEAAIERRGRARAEKKLTSTERYETSWVRGPWMHFEKVSLGDFFLRVVSCNTKNPLVERPARVLQIDRFPTDKGDESVFLYLEVEKESPKKRLKTIRGELRGYGKYLDVIEEQSPEETFYDGPPRPLNRRRDFIHRFLNIWA